MALVVQRLKRKLGEFQPVKEYACDVMFPMSFDVGIFDVAVSTGRGDFF